MCSESFFARYIVCIVYKWAIMGQSYKSLEEFWLRFRIVGTVPYEKFVLIRHLYMINQHFLDLCRCINACILIL